MSTIIQRGYSIDYPCQIATVDKVYPSGKQSPFVSCTIILDTDILSPFVVIGGVVGKGD
jgi:hypothetical protein